MKIILILCSLIAVAIISGCASATASPPIADAVPMLRAEVLVEPTPPPRIAKVRVIELLPDEPVQKRLAVYNPDMWDYPYKDWTVTVIPDGEAWEGWYATTSTGKVIVEYEYSTSLIYGGLEQSADLKKWYRTFSIDWYEWSDGGGTRYRKQSYPCVVDPVTGEVGKQFFRLNFPWKELDGVQQ